MINNPYMYHPHPLLKRAADDICIYISKHPEWANLFEQGKMLGVLLCEDGTILKAYSGVVNGLNDTEGYFVPAVYDLSDPDDFYLQEDQEITSINKKITEEKNPATLAHLKQLRKEKSLSLQLKIFSHFNFVNQSGEYKNIVQIFADAKRGLPPGGSGECAAPKLLQRALQLGLTPVALAEFWYGRSPRNYRRVHGQFYPSCIEKCSPILAYTKTLPQPSPIGREQNESEDGIKIIFENAYIVIVSKPSGLLSVPAKDLSLPNVDGWLKKRYPECKLPFMLAHRLDQATSGLLIAAKDAQTHKQLQQAFEQKTIRKRYLALLEGNLPSDCGVISLPICPNPDDRPRQVVDWQFGKESVTRYHVLKREAGRTLIEFFPLTGRTHQLRMHAASPFGLDCPIVGDELYLNLQTHPLPSLKGREQNESVGTSRSYRLMLHAECIKLPIGFFKLRPPFEEGVVESPTLEFRERVPLEFHDPASFE